MMISVSHITKTYNKGTIHAINDISFEVEKGEIFGLIGPDGAGKTSLFRILTTLLLADSGEAKVNDWDVVKDYKKIRNGVGYMPGRFSLYQDLSVEENLNFFATIFDTTIEENYHLIKDIYEQIEPFKDRRAGKLSGGMKQKLALCCALIHKPVVLFLDEPTTGVDSVSRKEFWDMLMKLKAQEITILVSTPYMDEAVLCDRLALMQEGKILTIDTPEKIRASYPLQLFAVKTNHTYKVLNELRNYKDTESCFAFGDSIHVTFKTPTDEKTISKYLSDKGDTDLTVEKIEPTIEDSFIQMLKN
ncbi:MAG: ABC-type multidrug transport system, ATPase component [Bacteroidota bacterium]|nr:ABC-type multidrug transport system, ATPase component [Bacteroidota bacterium]